MADTRIIHRKAGTSAKVTALSDFEYRVWTQYILSADDYGVMPADAHLLQAENYSLKNRPTRKVQTALETIIDSRLIRPFEHQGVRYVWQPTWQTEQSIRFPRLTTRPVPPEDELTFADEVTLRLLRSRSEKSPKHLREVHTETRELSNTNTHTSTNTAIELPEESARETNRNPHHKPTNLINGREQREHGEHTWCSWPKRDGFCVWPSWHSKFMGQFGRPTADRELRDLYAATMAKYEGQSIGDPPKQFWQNIVTGYLGTVTAQPIQRPMTNLQRMALTERAK